MNKHDLIDLPTAEEVDPTDPVQEAIENYNYEEAARIVQSTQSIHLENLDEDVEILLKRRESELTKKHSDDEKCIAELKEETDQIISTIVINYQKEFNKLVRMQKEQMEELKKQWAIEHSRAEEHANKKIDDLYHTSKVLASCGCYERAIGLRDKIVNAKGKIMENECHSIDKQFQEQFLALNKRHKITMEALYNKMKREIELEEIISKDTQSIIYKNERVSESMSPIKSIIDINCSNELTMEDKRELINRLTPKSPRFHSNTGSGLLI